MSLQVQHNKTFEDLYKQPYEERTAAVTKAWKLIPQVEAARKEQAAEINAERLKAVEESREKKRTADSKKQGKISSLANVKPWLTVAEMTKALKGLKKGEKKRALTQQTKWQKTVNNFKKEAALSRGGRPLNNDDLEEQLRSIIIAAAKRVPCAPEPTFITQRSMVQHAGAKRKRVTSAKAPKKRKVNENGAYRTH